MELFTVTGKLKFFVDNFEMFDVCTTAMKNISAPMLTRVWQELEYHIDVF
jgi:hypothetical protein